MRCPDLAVTCASLDVARDVLPDPVMVVEVLSKSTVLVDRTIKVDEYLSNTSIFYYLMLYQDRQAASLLVRADDGWAEHQIGPDGSVSLPALGVMLPMAAPYAGALA